MTRSRVPLVSVLVTLLFGFSPLLRASDVPDAIAALRGTVTYVDFWAGWCAPCAESFPWLNRMQAKYGAQGLRVVGVGLDAETSKGDRFLKAHPPAFAIVRDPVGALAERYGVEGMPYSLLLDEQGRVIHRHVGYRSDETADYEKAIQAALAANGAHK